jgi:hypothetical protein
MNELLSFKGDKKIKEFYLQRLEQHYKADEITQGIGWSEGKGCAIGCLFNNYEYDLFPKLLGLPVDLAYLVDNIFEFLENKEAKLFPLEFIRAVKVRADLYRIGDKFKLYLLQDETNGIITKIHKDNFFDKFYDELIKQSKVITEVLTKVISMPIELYTEYSLYNPIWKERSEIGRELMDLNQKIYRSGNFLKKDKLMTICTAMSYLIYWSDESIRNSTLKYYDIFCEKTLAEKNLIYPRLKNKLLDLISECEPV